MTETGESSIEGGCACKAVRYRMHAPALIVHCCHCTWCQRETGASFALNAMIEAERVVLLEGQPEVINTPSDSGAGQRVTRCPKCKIALWSNYGDGDLVRFVRVGTLDEPGRFPPDVHIFTESKQPWVVIPSGQRAVARFYKRDEVWPKSSIERLSAYKAKRLASA